MEANKMLSIKKPLNNERFFVPYGLVLSNLIDDLQSLRNLINSRYWKSVF